MVRNEVIVDTNALLIPGLFGVDIFAELERLGYVRIIVPAMVLNELDKLRHRPDLKGKEKKAATLGYSLIHNYAHTSESERMHRACIVSLEEGDEESKQAKEDTDEMIVALAIKRKAAVLTIDELLKKKLSQAGIVTVYLRGGNRLEESE